MLIFVEMYIDYVIYLPDIAPRFLKTSYRNQRMIHLITVDKRRNQLF